MSVILTVLLAAGGGLFEVVLRRRPCRLRAVRDPHQHSKDESAGMFEDHLKMI
jgi:hypothetical protein